MSFSSRFLAFIMLSLGIPCLLHYDSVAKLLPHIQPAHAAPLDRFQKEKFERRIVAVGDLHGDYENTIEVLKFSEVIDDAGDWSGKVDFFVQTGDIIDRGPDTIRLFALMEKLRTQAEEQGGTVVSLMGNHEWMNAIGDWHDCTKLEYLSYEGADFEESELEAALGESYKGDFPNTRAIGKRMLAIYKATSSIGAKWAQNYTSAARLPLHPFLGELNAEYDKSKSPPTHELSHAALSFVHGGLSPTYNDRSPFPTKINELSKSLLYQLQTRDPQPRPKLSESKFKHDFIGLPKDASKAEKELQDDNGPLWYRGWAKEAEDEALCSAVKKVLDETGTRRMIMGHTTNVNGIISRCEGKILLIDTGISQHYKPQGGRGIPSALLIHYTLLEKTARKSKESIWEESEVVTALYGKKNEKKDNFKVLANDNRTITGNFGGYGPKKLRIFDRA